MADGQALPPEIMAPLAPFRGERPAAPNWFARAVARAPERSTFEVDGVALELLTWGEVGKPGLLFLHGNGAHADWWSFIAPWFADDWRVAAISWSGMGNSQWRPAYDRDICAAEILAAIGAAKLDVGPQKPILVAHSFGGFQAMHFAGPFAQHIRAAVIVDSVIPPPEKRRNAPTPRQRPNRIYPTFVEALARFRLAPPQPTDHLYIVDHIGRLSLKEVEGGWNWKFDPFYWTHTKLDDPGEVLAQIRAPIALIWGELSPLVTPETLDFMAASLPADTPMVAIPNADHHLMIDQPLAFVAGLRGLLAGWP